jgi:hypothetical protein
MRSPVRRVTGSEPLTERSGYRVGCVEATEVLNHNTVSSCRPVMLIGEGWRCEGHP